MGHEVPKTPLREQALLAWVMDLSSFFPYRVATLAEEVSRCLSQVYSARFQLNRDEWRVLSALSQHSPMKTAEVIHHTNLEKMQVSRAVSSLEEAGIIKRSTDDDDRRNRVLALTPAGRQLVRKIVPLVLAREQFLLEALDEQEHEVLLRAMDKLGQRARQLAAQG